jgi:hypothetical protein
MPHDQRCIDSNRFGDGFDCVCEPDWKAEATRLKGELRILRDQVAISGADARDQYGLSLAVEQEKVKLLIGVVAEAAKLFDMVRAEEAAAAFEGIPWPTGKTTWDMMWAWQAHPTVVAALREVKR